MIRAVALAGCAVLALLPGASARPGPRARVLWAWERAEDLRFAGPGTAVAVLAGTVTLSGAEARAVPRLQPLRVDPAQHLVGSIHVELDRTRRLQWTPAQRARAAAGVLALGEGFDEVQVDFEVRQSERPVLLDLLRDVRAGLRPGRRLSMTALASWCDTERWLGEAPVDEVVPMLFRMGPGGAGLLRRLAAGGDFGNRYCRTALAVAVDSPPVGLPPGRRVFLFDRRAWQPDDLAAIERSIE